MKRPIAFIPECTKTNGQGVLNIPRDALAFVRKATETFSVHSVRFDYVFNYHAPYNTTNVGGVLPAIKLMSQFSNKLQVQFMFNLKSSTDFEQVVRESLMSEGREFAHNLDFQDHKEFLKYWHATQQ